MDDPRQEKWQDLPSAFDARALQRAYEQIATSGASGLCCSPTDVYSSEELATLPGDVLRLSSGCGTPLNCAGIEIGDCVIDIGSGAGADCFLAAHIVGPTGMVVGVDPSPTMRAIAERHRDELQLSWVNFLEGTAEQLPVPNESADVVISNCVLSLASNPLAVWHEIGRVLRPGGRFVVSDIIGGHLRTPESKTRCETGLTWSEYRQALADSGFTGVEPLRVREVTFRDGHRAQSLTLRGWAGMPAAHRSAQVFASAQHHAVAQQIVACCGRAGHRRGAPLGLRAIDLADPDGRGVLRLVLQTDLRGWDGENWPALAVVGEGRLIATWDQPDIGLLAAGIMAEHALDQLLMTCGAR